MVGQLVDYKRTDLAVQAFNKMGKKLVIIGAGEQFMMLKSIAAENVTILGYQEFSKIRESYSKCKALIFPGVEDFGMVPIEAMASGRPVIAFARGGALDYVRHSETGILFQEQTVESLIAAVLKFEEEGVSYTPQMLKDYADRFSAQEFQSCFRASVEEQINKLGATDC
jgi:glycosyltransferase involved in cell wall biosynthesis